MVNQRIVVGAGYGFGDWLLQRITAVVMAVYLVLIGLILLMTPSLSRESWHLLMSGTCMRVITLLFIVSLAYHVWVGVRDIWMDYVKAVGVRLVLHTATALFLIACAGWATQILWRL
jgi:succinate dehydrogenase / fumarate reductase membrane anchor subunit